MSFNLSKKSHVVKSALTSAVLVATMGATTMTAQAAGLSDLFGNNKSSSSKFLSVDKAFGVVDTAKTTSKGTQLAIKFKITPGHYVYKDRLTLTFPKGVRATPFTFSQSPVSVNDPTFGRVPVFDQATMIATTTLTSTNGKPLKNADLVIGWQGCAKAGLCYPPEKIKTSVNILAAK
ncbi:protein-disulfide reductase DsbD N-terminal domain-containing protein [Psychrobacter sp. M13]|uniref:protein-disulfide reductase DsbD N-terminal domain-containing protein n=1 Tax=Psychrobacter sp. M13 TaxID=3067275 RepID=UPI00273B35D8|nr:protein-disulfide reductase DsbD N-terminal domain-containing protein [Psychrobacter sp. M13]WLP94834.1 protein-disulfide reductase DsbD N-terminal domain-containing protein [Psychrobacter sp. M13]